MQHFILTRFNLQTNFWDKDKNRKEVLDDSWLKVRIELFLKFCLPSVVGQTTKNFSWFIFFQKGTEKDLSEVLEQLEKYDFIIPVFCENYEGFRENKGKIISKYLKSESEFLISTRLDNDDAIAKDFVEKVHGVYYDNKEKEFVIDFPWGLCLDVNQSPQLSAYKHVSNQFISFVEKTHKGKEPRTVLSHEHYAWQKIAEFISIEEKNMWLQVSHDRNITNRLEGNLVFEQNIKNFSIPPIDFKWYYNTSVILHRIRKPFSKMYGKYFLKRMLSKFKKQ